jgi:hypothetical protein
MVARIWKFLQTSPWRGRQGGEFTVFFTKIPTEISAPRACRASNDPDWVKNYNQVEMKNGRRL